MSIERFQIGTQPFRIDRTETQTVTVTARGSQTVYYGNSPSVSSTSNTGSLANGATVSLPGTYWFVVASGTSWLEVGYEVASSSSGSPLGQQLALKLAYGQGGTLLFISDSTGDEAGEWPDLITRQYAAAFPLVTVNETFWADGGSTYPASTQVQAGDGSHGTLNVYICSVASQTTFYFMAPYFDAMVASIQPDLTIVGLGHNENTALAGSWRDSLISFCETVTCYCPLTEVILTTQNPRTDSTASNQAARRYVTQQVAQLRGFGCVDTFRLFLDAAGGTDTSLLKVDGIHPNGSGEGVIATDVWSRLKYRAQGLTSVSRQSSSLLSYRTTALANADFASFASPPTLTSWTATNATLSQNVTNFEGANGYSVRAIPATAAIAYFQQAITSNALKPFLGKIMTFAVRLRVVSGVPANSGRLSLFTTGGSNTFAVTTIATTQGQGDFRWQTASGRVDVTAGTLTCRIFAENGTTGTGDISVDRVWLGPGLLPFDLR